MAPKPTHIRAVSDLLESEEFESSTDMAKALIAKYDEMRKDDVSHHVVIQYGEEPPLYIGYGPYSTRNQAAKAIEKGVVNFLDTAKVAIVPSYTPVHAEEQFIKHLGVSDRYERVQ